jgi:CDP-diacylglycerol--serine O-phosphatidyltransferase
MVQKKSKSFNLAKVLPNLITLFGLCIGLSAIRFAIDASFVKAISFLFIAAFLDGVDGRLARFLNSTSDFGAQLDSLADFVNFGIVPVLILYLWINQYSDIYILDWAMVLFFAVCMAIRLARFNVDIDSNNAAENKIQEHFFYGIPAPCGAVLAVLPMVLFYESGHYKLFVDPSIIILYVLILAIMLASTIPTFSIKKISIANEYLYITLIIMGLIIVGLVIKPWITIILLEFLYIGSIPISIIMYFKLKKSQIK